MSQREFAPLHFNNRIKGTSGFGLIEAMVAIAILAVAGVAITYLASDSMRDNAKTSLNRSVCQTLANQVIESIREKGNALATATYSPTAPATVYPCIGCRSEVVTALDNRGTVYSGSGTPYEASRWPGTAPIINSAPTLTQVRPDLLPIGYMNFLNTLVRSTPTVCQNPGNYITVFGAGAPSTLFQSVMTGADLIATRSGQLANPLVTLRVGVNYFDLNTGQPTGPCNAASRIIPRYDKTPINAPAPNSSFETQYVFDASEFTNGTVINNRGYQVNIEVQVSQVSKSGPAQTQTCRAQQKFSYIPDPSKKLKTFRVDVSNGSLAPINESARSGNLFSPFYATQPTLYNDIINSTGSARIRSRGASFYNFTNRISNLDPSLYRMRQRSCNTDATQMRFSITAHLTDRSNILLCRDRSRARVMETLRANTLPKPITIAGLYFSHVGFSSRSQSGGEYRIANAYAVRKAELNYSPPPFPPPTPPGGVVYPPRRDTYPGNTLLYFSPNSSVNGGEVKLPIMPATAPRVQFYDSITTLQPGYSYSAMDEMLTGAIPPQSVGQETLPDAATSVGQWRPCVEIFKRDPPFALTGIGSCKRLPAPGDPPAVSNQFQDAADPRVTYSLNLKEGCDVAIDMIEVHSDYSITEVDNVQGVKTIREYFAEKSPGDLLCYNGDPGTNYKSGNSVVMNGGVTIPAVPAYFYHCPTSGNSCPFGSYDVKSLPSGREAGQFFPASSWLPGI